jgi:hypothetical protein
MIFELAVRRLRWLAVVPPLPQIFDAYLLTWTALFRRRTSAAIDEFKERALEMDGIEGCAHRFGGIGFKFNGVEIAHVHGNGLLDVELTRGVADLFVASGRAKEHHVFGPSRWVSYWIRDLGDVERALGLVKVAIDTSTQR